MFKAKNMGVSPSQVDCHRNTYSCPKQNSSEETPDYEISEQEHKISSEIVQTEPLSIGTVVAPLGATEALKLSSDNDVKISHIDNLDPPPEGACKSSLTDKSSGLKLTAVDQKLEFGSEDTDGELVASSEQTGPAKEKDSLWSGIVKNDNELLISTNQALQPEHIAKISLLKGSEIPCEDASNSLIDGNLCNQLSTADQKREIISDGATFGPLPDNKMPGSVLIQSGSVEVCNGFSCSTASRHAGRPLATQISPVICLGLPSGRGINFRGTKKLELPHDNMHNHLNLQLSEIPSKDSINNSSQAGRHLKSPAKSTKRKYRFRSLTRSDRVMWSRSQEKPKAPETNANGADTSSSVEKTRKKSKRRPEKRIIADEYSRIKTHFKYLLNRIRYEQSLITAYSAEGWKGLSLEKLKPEKELQRATSEILRRKLNIRDLFQRIDSLCAEGRYPESLFDSEGQISSEDIFCAKCGSKDMTVDNDIILCDGACDRGFHQFCLIPPLLKEDIPPDDEGWLCPGCDCKIDCIEMLNDSQGTNISISDSWEKVFPEAAAAGENPDPNLGLPSDDSDDNDYDPAGPENEGESQQDESSDDESDFASASDEFKASPGDDQQLGLSSDDEDDSYDPDVPDHDEDAKNESSSSDFTSDSEDLTATLDGNKLSGKDGGNKKQSIHRELSMLETTSRQDRFASISVKRNVERLDYKKLYDETYGHASSDSSDDEDFTDNVQPRPRRKRTESTEVDPVSLNVIETLKQNVKEMNTPTRSHQKLNLVNTSVSSSEAHEGSLPPSSCGKPVRSSRYKRLAETVIQGLHKSFNENQYPDRAKKEILAKELGITYKQVSKWFENTRWSFNHPPSADAARVRKTSVEEDSSLPIASTELGTTEPETSCRNTTCNGVKSEEIPKIGDATEVSYTGDSRESREPESKTPNSRKRKHLSDHQTPHPDSAVDPSAVDPTVKLEASLPKPQDTQAGGRITRSRKSV